ncbi:MAG: tetratricopeptide repeat protein [Alphaproteobacteria bacterium]
MTTTDGSPGAHLALGDTLKGQGHLGEAMASYLRAIALRPDLADAHYGLGTVLQDLGRLDEAGTRFIRTLDLDPGHARAYDSLGNVLAAVGRLGEAVIAYGRAVEARPDFAAAYNNLGAVLHDLGREDEAAVAYDHAIAIRPGFAEAHNNLGILHHRRGSLDQAETHYRQALAAAPGLAEAHDNLGLVLQTLGRAGEAEERHRCALKLRPDFANAHNNLGSCLQQQGHLDEARACFRKTIQLAPNTVGAHSNLIFLLDYEPGQTTASQQEERRRWYERHARPLVTAAATTVRHANLPDPGRRLRVGYVSADFRQHSAARIFGPVIANHDPGQVETVCYSGVTAEEEDDTTALIRRHASLWRRTAAMSDEALAATVRADGIDILVDLSGHSGGNRLLVFARRPAPVQVTAWGLANGTGLPVIDAFLADPVAVPPAERPLFAETVVDLPCIIALGRPEEAPPVGPLPALSAGHVTFGCLNRLAKVSPAALALWARVLSRVPESRLVIKDTQLNDPDQRRRLLDAMTGLGIAAGRLELLGGTGRAEHLAVHGRVDIALDTLPQTGGVTSLEALWQGVPVVTLEGTTPAARTCAAVNAALGLEAFIAADEAAYVDLAVTHAADLSRLASLRAGLRQRLEDSPVGNPALYTRAVESVYRDLWRRWCGGGRRPVSST